jgi:hypothetical protein
MFAANQPRAAAELLRVTRPGGTIALASWTPTGYVGEMFRTTAAHVPSPSGAPSPFRWGTEEGLTELFGDAVSSLDVQEQTYTFRFTSAEEFVSFFRAWYGPTLKAFDSLDAEGQSALEAALVALARRHDRAPEGSFAVDATYLEAIATRS